STSLLLPWGSEVEHARSRRIAAALANARVPDRQALDRMAALMAGASFVIGVDTGLIHLAAALGVPLVAISTGSEPGRPAPMRAWPHRTDGNGSDRGGWRQAQAGIRAGCPRWIRTVGLSARRGRLWDNARLRSTRAPAQRQ